MTGAEIAHIINVLCITYRDCHVHNIALVDWLAQICPEQHDARRLFYQWINNGGRVYLDESREYQARLLQSP